MTTENQAAPAKKKAHRFPASAYSMEYLRGLGMIPWPVERLIPSKPFPKKSDCFGIFDLVYLNPENPQVGFVQTTTWHNRKSHIEKMEANAMVIRALWAVPSVHTELHGWKKIDGKWQVFVWRTTFDGERVTLQEIQAPTMSEARASARERKKRIIERLD